MWHIVLSHCHFFILALVSEKWVKRSIEVKTPLFFLSFFFFFFFARLQESLLKITQMLHYEFWNQEEIRERILVSSRFEFQCPHSVAPSQQLLNSLTSSILSTQLSALKRNKSFRESNLFSTTQEQTACAQNCLPNDPQIWLSPRNVNLFLFVRTLKLLWIRPRTKQDIVKSWLLSKHNLIF